MGNHSSALSRKETAYHCDECGRELNPTCYYFQRRVPGRYCSEACRDTAATKYRAQRAT